MVGDTGNWVGLSLAGGRYQVTAKLGMGGMGHVYRAADRQSRSQVVIKVPRLATLEDPDFAGRFTREVRSLMRLAHPNIVSVVEMGEHERLPFVVMHFLPGGSLRDRLAGGVRPPGDLRAWLPQIAAALDFCHKNQCIHRDVKPDNILFDAQGQPFLSDFGIAKVLYASPKTRVTVLTGTGMVLGTPQYMAPELIMGERYDGRVDQYGLAVTVYEMLSGRVPVQGNNPAAILVQQTTQAPPALHTVSPSVTRPLSEAVQRAIAKNPMDRYPDCLQFANAVLSVLDQPAIRVQAPGRKPATGAVGKAKRTTVVTGKGIAVPTPGGGKRLSAPKPETAQQESLDSRRWSGREKALLGIVALFLALLLPLTWLLLTDTGSTVSKGEEVAQTLPRAEPALLPPAEPEPKQQTAADKSKDVEVEPPLTKKAPLLPESVEILPIKPVVLKAGSTTSVRVAVKRENYTGPLTLTLLDLPGKAGSLKAPPVMLPAFEEAAPLEIEASWDAGELQGNGRLVVRGTGLEDKVQSVLIKVSPPSITLSIASPEIVLAPGEQQNLQVRVNRDDYRGFIKLELLDLPDGLKSNNQGLAAGGESAVIDTLLTLSARQGLPAMTRKVRVVATSDKVKWAEHEFRIRVKTIVDPCLLHVLTDHEAQITCLAMSRDTPTAISGDRDGTVIVWDVKKGEPLKRFNEHRAPVSVVRLSPDGQCAVSAGETEDVFAWNVASGMKINHLKRNYYHNYDLSPDGDLVVGFAGSLIAGRKIIDEWVALRESRTGKQLWSITNSAGFGERFTQMGAIEVHGRASFSSDGSTIIFGFGVNPLSRVSVKTGKKIDGDVYNSKWQSADGKSCLSEEPSLIDAKSGDVLLSYNRPYDVVGPSSCVAVTSDGRLVGSGSFALLDAIRARSESRSDPSKWDGVVRIWERATGKEVCQFQGHTGRVDCIAFSRDGKLVLTGGSDRTVRLWRIP